MTRVATICARGGSQGVPGKNIKMLCGKPLIAHTIEQALECDLIDEVYVSTDCAEIASVAKEFGAKVPFMRPDHLATNSAPKIPVIEHLLGSIVESGVNVSTIIDLDPTSPLRSQEDIKACVSLLTEDVDAVITAFSSDKNPYFNMVEVSDEGYAGLVKPLPGGVFARQMAPEVYAMNASIYVWHYHSISKGVWEGKTKLYVMPRERSIDIDSPLDFKLVELLMRERDNDNK
jgi:CMP-N-acetylneuraminic acid synthetase